MEMTITVTLPKTTEHSGNPGLTLDLKSLSNDWDEGTPIENTLNKGGFIVFQPYKSTSGALTSKMTAYGRIQQDLSDDQESGMTRLSVNLTQTIQEDDDVNLTTDQDLMSVTLAVNIPTRMELLPDSLIRTAVCELLGIIYPDAATTVWGTSVFETMRHGSVKIIG